ncbi:GNAT family N-acetyltransferase [Nocardioides litoris]|uniref:GNAT family N-acetyltransferase n=1 Tax=Nocardioides litoris TaxID=1926648 RepID=UPI00111F2055|nr:GNAT family N-acetyltransferase [Nocardioides litoris]
MAFDIRRIAPADHEEAAAALLAAYADHIRAEPAYAERLADLGSRDREAEVWVAADGPQVLGTVTFCPPGSPYREVARDDEGEFRMLAVHPAAQGRGVGRALTELALTESRRRGFAAVALSSTTTMTTAHRLYESLGFVRDPARDWTPAPGVDLLVYRLELHP